METNCTVLIGRNQKGERALHLIVHEDKARGAMLLDFIINDEIVKDIQQCLTDENAELGIATRGDYRLIKRW